MRAQGAAPKAYSTFGRGLIEREHADHTSRAHSREARRLRDRDRLEAAWRALTREART